MTFPPRPGEAFHLEVDGTSIDGRYVEVDPPHRMVIDWDHEGTVKATPTRVEITFTPHGGTTSMTVDFAALSADDAERYGAVWRRYLDSVAARFGGTAPSEGK